MGYIIVIEGTDGSGKQTQSSKLYERLKAEGIDVVMHSFPSYDSPSSGPVKMYLGGELCKSADGLNAYQSSSLFAIDRLCTYQKSLKAHYENGGVIIFDRYVESNMLHQACKIKEDVEREKFLNWLDDYEFNRLKLPRPDKVLFLDMPPRFSMKLAKERAGLKAGTKQDIHEQDKKYLLKAYETGMSVAQKYDWEVVKCVSKRGIKTIDEISDEIFEVVIKGFGKEYQMGI